MYYIVKILNIFNNEISLTRTKVHIRLVNRTRRRFKTIIENLSEVLSDDMDCKKILKICRVKYCCNGHIENNVIILQGDHCNNIQKFLIENNIVDSENILIHGI